MTNRECSDLIQDILVESMDFDQDDPGTAVTDLLADIRHYCDAHALAFHECDRRAYQHYSEEKGDERLGLEEKS